jgi:hypothetical protein
MRKDIRTQLFPANLITKAFSHTRSSERGSPLALQANRSAKNARKPEKEKLQFFAKNSRSWSSSHFTSSLLSPGPVAFVHQQSRFTFRTEGRKRITQNLPPAQCPQMDGKTLSSPIPGRMFSTSISESSGAVATILVSQWLHIRGLPSSTSCS